TAQRLDVPPFKVCSSDILLKMAHAAETGESEATILASVHLGRRHERLAASLATAVKAGLACDPKTLPRRRGRDPNHVALTQAEIERLDRIKDDRDKIAAKLQLEPTLIANRSQLAQIARSPARLDELLLPWQADLLRGVPSLQPS
ncbi:MAG TPA: 3'-5' exonuclease, partial [Opitutus sp.]|nr:3'-5' exonuclease [Opitutus sp.]